MIGQLLQSQPVVNMRVDVVKALGHRSGDAALMLYEAHLTCKVKDHTVMYFLHFFDGRCVVETADVVVAHTEGALGLEAVLYAASGDDGGGHDHMIFDICQRFGGQKTNTGAVHEAVLVTVLVDRFHISGVNIMKEGQFLAGIAVNGRVFII